MAENKFKTVFIALVPDSNYPESRTEMQAGKYQLISILVKDANEAIEVSKELVEKGEVDSFILCPGFTNQDVARITDIGGEKISTAIARGDGPSNKAALQVLDEIGWFSQD